jgi:hypothetical protein
MSELFVVSSAKCRDCPGGYECKTDATSTPMLCRPGLYRQASDNVACEQCPQGAWSKEFSSTAPELCEPCPVSFELLFSVSNCKLQNMLTPAVSNGLSFDSFGRVDWFVLLKGCLP